MKKLFFSQIFIFAFSINCYSQNAVVFFEKERPFFTDSTTVIGIENNNLFEKRVMSFTHTFPTIVPLPQTGKFIGFLTINGEKFGNEFNIFLKPNDTLIIRLEKERFYLHKKDQYENQINSKFEIFNNELRKYQRNLKAADIPLLSKKIIEVDSIFLKYSTLITNDFVNNEKYENFNRVILKQMELNSCEMIFNYFNPCIDPSNSYNYSFDSTLVSNLLEKKKLLKIPDSEFQIYQTYSNILFDYLRFITILNNKPNTSFEKLFETAREEFENEYFDYAIASIMAKIDKNDPNKLNNFEYFSLSCKNKNYVNHIKKRLIDTNIVIDLKSSKP